MKETRGQADAAVVQSLIEERLRRRRRVINIVLWLVGFVLLALGIGAAGPFAQMKELDRLAENAKRYDSWRGGSH